VEGGDKGRPVLEEDGDSPFKKAVLAFADAVTARLNVKDEPTRVESVH